VYAKALYEAASEAGRTEQIRRDPGEFVRAAASSAELRHLLVTDEISNPKKKEILLELTEGGEDMVRNLLRLLVDKSRESEVSAIYRAFVGLVEEAQGLVHVEVVSAVQLPAEIQETLRAKIAASLGKTIELKLSVDKELLGGLKLRIGDKVADASVRHRLERLRESLISPVASLEGSVETAS
jgi:F-type H+-transporting ATPase subunit delta